jgi:hypothetical protein
MINSISFSITEKTDLSKGFGRFLLKNTLNESKNESNITIFGEHH